MKYKLLDCVVLTRDFPEFGLCVGDLGTIVAIYKPDGLEVEFVKASGETQAVITLTEEDVRAIKSEDIINVRSLKRLSEKVSILRIKDERRRILKKTEEELERMFPVGKGGKGRRAYKIAGEVYPVLSKVAEMKGFVSYGWIQRKFGIGQVIAKVVGQCSEWEIAKGNPRISAVVINKRNFMSGEGFFGLPKTPPKLRGIWGRSLRGEKWEELPSCLKKEGFEYWFDQLIQVYEHWKVEGAELGG